jgi:TBC1 domain family member 15
MDLESTLIRAEQLYRRFRRLVEAVDKKHNFPPPRFNAPSTGNGAGTSPPAKGKEPEDPQSIQNRVITPELRKLLSREVEIIPKKPQPLKKSTTVGH